MPAKSDRKALKQKPIIEIKKADDPSLPADLAEYLLKNDLVLAPNAAVKIIYEITDQPTSKDAFRKHIKELDLDWCPIEAFPVSMSLMEMQMKKDRLERIHESREKQKAEKQDEEKSSKKKSGKKSKKSPKGVEKVLEKLEDIEERLSKVEGKD